jgi:nucleoside-diphosphate-sugar epimerase
MSKAKAGFRSIPQSCLVTGGSGFVGQRLVEMLVERGCKRVVSFDIAPTPKDAKQCKEIEYVQGDLTNYDVVLKAAKGVEAIFHIAALVGPYHPKDAYVKVNYEGTLNILNACKQLGIKRLVMSSSPSTRFPYPDPNVDNLTEDELFQKNKGDYAPYFLQPYAETKALGEKAVLDACGNKEGDLLTIAVAPHQVH